MMDIRGMNKEFSRYHVFFDDIVGIANQHRGVLSNFDDGRQFCLPCGKLSNILVF